MAESIRITYVTGSTGTADDARRQYTGTDCTGTNLGTHGFHTITPLSAGTVEFESRQETAQSLFWAITGRGSAGSIHMRFEYSATGAFTDTVVLFDDIVPYGNGTQGPVCVAWGPLPTSFCQYGTRSKAGVGVQAFLSEPLVLAILSAVSASPLAPALVSFFGTVYLIEDLCSRLPPPVPVIDLSIWNKSAVTLKQLLDAAAWPYFCECIPGSPLPTGPPPPVIVIPPGLAVPTAPTCDPLDLCAAIVEILEREGRLEQTIGQLYKLVTTQQRYGLPFAYVRGRTLPRAAGVGSTSVQRIVGLDIEVKERPGGEQEFTGMPTYISDLGWISALTGDGMLDEIRLSRLNTVWFSKLLPTATQVGWGLRTGVAVDITELLAEP